MKDEPEKATRDVMAAAIAEDQVSMADDILKLTAEMVRLRDRVDKLDARMAPVYLKFVQERG